MAPIPYIDAVCAHRLVWLGPRSWQADLFVAWCGKNQLVRELASGNPFRLMSNQKKGESAMSKLTGTLEGKSISNRGHSGYKLDMSGILDVDGNPIEVRLIGEYKLPGGNPKGRFVITTGRHQHDREEGVSWLEARFESTPRLPELCIFRSSDQGGVFQGTEEGEFKLEIELRKYGSMDDHWKITFGPY